MCLILRSNQIHQSMMYNPEWHVGRLPYIQHITTMPCQLQICSVKSMVHSRPQLLTSMVRSKRVSRRSVAAGCAYVAAFSSRRSQPVFVCPSTHHC